MYKREQDEKKGILEPRQVTGTKEKKYSMKNQMSRMEYKEKYNDFGTIGKIK